jgi:hypothetical protein
LSLNEAGQEVTMKVLDVTHCATIHRRYGRRQSLTSFGRRRHGSQPDSAPNSLA